MKVERSLNRSLIFAVGAAAAVLLLGGIGQRWVVAMVVSAKPPPLVRPLSELPKEIGPWRGSDVPLAEGVIKISGTNEHANRVYVDDASRNRVEFYVGYCAHPALMLGHRPDVCFPNQGWTERSKETGSLEKEGQPARKCLVYRFSRKDNVAGEHGMVVLNYFILNGRHTTDWTEFDGLASRRPNLDRDVGHYVAQVQVRAMISEPADASVWGRQENVIKRFAAEMAPFVAATMPGATAPEKKP